MTDPLLRRSPPADAFEGIDVEAFVADALEGFVVEALAADGSTAAVGSFVRWLSVLLSMMYLSLSQRRP